MSQATLPEVPRHLKLSKSRQIHRQQLRHSHHSRFCKSQDTSVLHQGLGLAWKPGGPSPGRRPGPAAPLRAHVQVAASAAGVGPPRRGEPPPRLRSWGPQAYRHQIYASHPCKQPFLSKISLSTLPHFWSSLPLCTGKGGLRCEFPCIVDT